MLSFLKNYWSEILSIVGAAAWLPIVVAPIVNYFRKIHATVLDTRILTDGSGFSVGRKQKKTGTILLFVTNIFIKKVTFFAKDISISVKLKNGAWLKTQLLDFSGIVSNNFDGTKSTYDVAFDYEFNISRTIYADVDNLKYIAVLVENAAFATSDDISEINIKLCYNSVFKKIFSKKLVIRSEDFPTFNSSHLIDNVEKIEQ